MTAPHPPAPFDPLIEELPTGFPLYRVFRVRPGRTATTFNPGLGRPTRFAFFGHPVVPALYAGSTPEAAVAETLLHDAPLSGGVVLGSVAEQHVAALIRPTRTLRVAQLHGFGLRRLGVTAAQVTETPPTDYPSTVAWAEAAHAVGCDGVSWMGRQHNSSRAFVLFGDRVQPSELAVDASWAQAFASASGREWLAEICAASAVALTPPSA